MSQIFAFVKVLPRFKFTPSNIRKLLVVLTIVGVGVGAFLWGRAVSMEVRPRTDLTNVNGVSNPNDPNGVVAYLKGNIPITRMELGNYLIDRLGAERIDNLVNRRIIELACRDRNIFVTDAEVDAQFSQDMQALSNQNVNQSEFAMTILKRFNKSLFEWKEDIIRPRIAMKKLLQWEIKITDEDITNAYEMRFGPQVECRMIVMRSHSPGHWGMVREQVVVSKEAFYKAAADEKIQLIDLIRKEHGKIPNIYRHFGEPLIEKAAFALREGEVSQVIEMPDSTAVLLLCEKHIPSRADKPALDAQVKSVLYRDVMETRINQRIPEKLKELRQVWDPTILLPRLHHAKQLAMANGANGQMGELVPPPPKALESVDKGDSPAPPPPISMPLPPRDIRTNVPLELPPPGSLPSETNPASKDATKTAPESSLDPLRNPFGVDTGAQPSGPSRVFPVPEVPALKSNPSPN